MSAEVIPFPKDLPKEALARMSPGEKPHHYYVMLHATIG